MMSCVFIMLNTAYLHPHILLVENKSIWTLQQPLNITGLRNSDVVAILARDTFPGNAF